MIKVYVKKARGKFHLVTVHPDGSTNWQVTDCSRRRDAQREAQQLEAQLQISNVAKCDVMSFDDSCTLYSDAHLSKLSPGYKTGFWSVVAKLKELRPIEDMNQLNQKWLDVVSSDMVQATDSISTAEGYLKILRAFVNWLVNNGHLSDVTRVQLADGSFEVIRQPFKVAIPSVDTDEAAGGEAITFAQFKQLIEAVPLVVEATRARGFIDLLWGFWYSGFRRNELFSLSWDDTKSIHVDCLGDDTSFIMFPRGAQKAKRFERWVMPPDMQKHLRQIPGDKVGHVYQPLNLRLQRYQTASTVGDVLSKIFDKAKVKVEGSDGELRKGNTKDIRRAASVRWYRITKDPDKVARLMRHRSFKTTKRWYQKQQDEQFANELSAMWR